MAGAAREAGNAGPRPGPRNLITDVPGLLVGNAQEGALRSGVTVLTAEAPFVASAHVMGGAPGTRELALLDPARTVQEVDALVLSGGSAFGLSAACGVADALRESGRGFAVGPVRVPIVPAAILFDLLNGGAKDWAQNPYPALGREALAAAAPGFQLGSTGAGMGALTGAHRGGLGSASQQLDSGLTVGALVAANPIGSVTPKGSRHFWAAALELDQEAGGLGPCPAPQPFALADSAKLRAHGGNTTIAIVATDAPLSKAQAHRMATSAHDGIARAVMPAHTPMDGDLVFATATGGAEIEPAAVTEALPALCEAAANTLARAIMRAIFHAAPDPDSPLPAWNAPQSA